MLIFTLDNIQVNVELWYIYIITNYIDLINKKILKQIFLIF